MSPTAGAFGWTTPNEEQFRFHITQILELGGFLPPATEDVPLELIETRAFGSRVIYERYRRVHDDSD